MSEPTSAEVVIARTLIETAAKITAAPMSMMTALSLATAVLAALKEEYTDDVEYVIGPHPQRRYHLRRVLPRILLLA